ncbi:diaminobutyrate acetyltransferase [Paenibacillus melissococcoides]|uniref:L-2,4-diaminobutyric acid acetyltransferase n=1 Tax=Paenibacillus melissococcoides TaxID=2912268 RepID=A0ABM9G7R1_9BACL|nr:MULTISPECIES: diaminobutyrate acetyltransferase [Paenibacillus]MEB9893912.1 diaminobutyrate acetyltransferase [Bacillus cereus]CAH8247965.1 diaminobutyrate acetyltransferase [Paenibacillus melissococcoides]CAH8719014.1 diaminobutyrate acetyltransferase [Paenibacillus melissococcoides]CAH8720021.1 diaminobutyrate acetyltransferase [Paenibacillus melissococcoides]GIO80882.1 L-2,4-diaminobutyric acid acetyltransferase [Paenibacillus dendritiformis]
MEVNVTRSLPCTIRNARKGDGTELWKLVTESGTLDVNSAYCYIMLCEYFAYTCLVAERNRKLIGFVSALRPPERTDTLFVWQIAVRDGYRGRGIAESLLRTLYDTACRAQVRFMETTITPSNTASQRLFAKMAKTWKSALVTKEGFSAHLFPEGAHETEKLIRIGPLRHNTHDRMETVT